MNKENIIKRDINDEMKKSYIDYAMSVIVGRALPDVRDGLKPVHRRILYSMYKNGMTPDKPYKKSAHVVGDVLAKYHPHGDTSVYDAMVRMVQPFSTRHPLVDGHGNFGSVDGDSAGAMRYTEVRMDKVSMELLNSIEKNTVDFKPNYDESLEEPTVLPSPYPNILVNGSSGIAVGMATNIPPHNLGEVIDGVNALIKNPEITNEELCKYIKSPDFPTGGVIVNKKDIKSVYSTGNGSVKVRGKHHIEETENKKKKIIITEIPYLVNKAKLIEKIAELVKDKKIDGITDLRDESDRTGMRIVIELKRGINPQIILNQLYKYSQLEDNFAVIMLVLVNGQPKVLTLKDILFYYLEHQKQVITRRVKFDLDKAENKSHITEGLKIALDNINEVISIIRKSKNSKDAKCELIKVFSLSEKQAQAVLDMRLQRLTGLEKDGLEEEYNNLSKEIFYFKNVLSDENKITDIIRKEITLIKDKHSDKRRTEILDVLEIETFKEDEFTEDFNCRVFITKEDYIKKIPLTGLRGNGEQKLKPGDEIVLELESTNNTGEILVFTNKANCYKRRLSDIPESKIGELGEYLPNLLELKNESILKIIPTSDFKGQVLFCFKDGKIAKIPLKSYWTEQNRKMLKKAYSVESKLINIIYLENDINLIAISNTDKILLFNTSEINSKATRTSVGVQVLKLKKDDSMVDIKGSDEVKFTDLEYYRSNISRAGKTLKKDVDFFNC